MICQFEYPKSGTNSLCVSLCDILILFIPDIPPFFFIFQCFLRLVPSGIGTIEKMLKIEDFKDKGRILVCGF